MRRSCSSIACAAALFAAGCGGDDGPEDPVAVRGDTLTVYASLPAHGPSATAGESAELGMREALADAGARAADRRVRLVVLPSTRVGDEGWDPGTVEANAERAVDDPTTVAYLGELDQGGSAVSLPVTNEAGILQVAPADGLTSLTRTPPGRPRSGPERYYPQGQGSFLRLVPQDLAVARALIEDLERREVRRLAILHGDQIADRELEAMVGSLATARGMLVTSDGSLRDDPEHMRELVAEVAAERPQALVLTDVAGPVASTLLAELAVQMPDVPVLGGPPLALAAPRAATPESAVAVTGVLPALERGRRSTRLLAALRRECDCLATPEALLGYEAMSLTLDAVEDAGPNRRAIVRRALAPRERGGAIGRYAVVPTGDVRGPGLWWRPLDER